MPRNRTRTFTIALALLVACQSPSPSASSAPSGQPTAATLPGVLATFDWTTPDRFGLDRNGNGLLDIPNTPEYVNNVEGQSCAAADCAHASPTFEVTLTAKLSGVSDARVDVFTWLISLPGQGGSVRHESTEARFVRRFEEGTYAVALQIAYTSSRTGAERPFVALANGLLLVHDMLVVSIGDSMSSGEGNPERPRSESNQCRRPAHQQELGKTTLSGISVENRLWADDGLANLGDCSSLTKSAQDHIRSHRSSLSWPAQAALAIERADRRTSVTFISVAASGARIPEGLLGPYDGVNNEDIRLELEKMPAQIEQVRTLVGTRAVDALTISIGINDAGFSNLVLALLDTDRFFDPVTYEDDIDDIGVAVRSGNWSGIGALTTDFGDADGIDKLASEQGLYKQLDAAIRTLNVEKTYIVEYPDPTRFMFLDRALATCDNIAEDLDLPLKDFREIDSYEANWLRAHFIDPLNGAVKAAASRYAWTYVGGIADDFTTHGYCGNEPPYKRNPQSASGWRSAAVDPWPTAEATRWVRRAQESWELQGPDGAQYKTKGVFHPNDYGHRAIKERLLDVLVYPESHPWAGGKSWADQGNRGRWYVGDFDGDGKDDLLRQLDDTGGAEVKLSTGDSFAATELWSSEGFRVGPWYVGDFDGDGKADLLRPLDKTGGGEVKLSTGKDFARATLWTESGFRGGPWFIGDFDGDGKDDLLRKLDENGGAEVKLSTGTGFAAANVWTDNGFRGGPWYIGDFDGDGRDDLLRKLDENGGAEVKLSTGSGFADTQLWTRAGFRSGPWFVGDFNGDGKDDLLRQLDHLYGGAEVLLSTGGAFSAADVWSEARNRRVHWLIGNFDGRPGDDVLRQVNEFGGAEVFSSTQARFVPTR